MTGSVALDVVIGLVFIYLLYSLFATIIMEIIAALFGLRARNLRFAIRRMLMDEKENGGKKENSKWKKLFIDTIKKYLFRVLNSLASIGGWSINITNPELFKNFYDQATIKYLSSGGISNKPSYLTPQNFSKALIDSLKTGNVGKSTLIKIKAGLDSLSDGSQTKEFLESLLDDANNDLVKFKFSLEQWFDDTMERATGWFKRSIQFILLIIGFVLAVSFNADTLEIIRKLSKDPEARQQLVDMAISYAEENKETIDYVNSLKGKTAGAKDTLRLDKIDSTLIAKIDSLTNIRKSLKEDIYEAQNVLSSNWRISDKLKVYANKEPIEDSIVFEHKIKVLLDENTRKYNNKCTIYLAVHKSVNVEIIKEIIPKKISQNQLNMGIPIKPGKYKRRYVFATNGFLNFTNLWGYLLTALAISLGSPFWFDLLNKLIKLRSSVAKPTQSSQPQSSSSTVNPNDPTSTQNRVA